MTIRYVILGCLGIAGFCVVGVLTAGWLLIRFADTRAGNLPELPPAGVLGGEGRFLKSVLIEDRRLEAITFIGPGIPRGGPADGLVVVSPSGALYLDASMKERSYVPLADSATHVDAIDVDRDGAYEYLRRGSWSEDAAILDSKGTIAWTYGGWSGVDDMAAGDLTGDGTISYAAGFNGAGGIHRVSGDGKKVWSKSGGNVWHVEIFDTDKDGISEIIHSDASGKITVRDPEGGVVRTARIGDYVSFFSPCRWPDAPEESLVLAASEGEFLVADTTGKVYERYPAPGCDQLGESRGVPVTFRPGEAPYFAVLLTLRGGSCLYIYDSEAALVYQESLGDEGEVLTAWPDSAPGGGETLLVGGNGRVWQFRAAPNV